MARPTIASLTLALEASRAECAQLRKLNAEWGCQSQADKRTIKRLKSLIPAAAPNSAPCEAAPGFRPDAALLKRYFDAHPGLRSVSPQDLFAFASA